MALLNRLKDLCALERHVIRRFWTHTVISKERRFSTLKVPILKPPKPITFQRHFIIKKSNPNELKVRDNVPDEYLLIYRNQMGKYITVAHISVAVAVLIMLGAASINPDYKNYSMKYDQWSEKTKTVENEVEIFLCAFVLLVTVIVFTITKTPLRIYKVPERPQYVMFLPSYLPLNVRQIRFQRGAISAKEESGILPWQESRYVIKSEHSSKSVLLWEHYFRRPADHSIMLGEQRDPDEIDQ